jgi:hypothetical protein
MSSLNDMTAKTPVEWKVSDVHAWSNSINTTLQTEFPDMIKVINELESKYTVARYHVYLKLKENNNDGKYDMNKVEIVLKMFDDRKTLRDGALSGISCSGCLCMAFCLLSHYSFDKSLLNLFYDALMDMGTTCLQGFTHRLLSFIIPLKRCVDKDCAVNSETDLQKLKEIVNREDFI